MNIETFLGSLNLEENDYFYHITGRGNGERIVEEGLLVDGTNILDTDNILYTTTISITPDMVSNSEGFERELLDMEISNKGIRDCSEMVIIGAPKEMQKQIVSHFGEDIDGNYFEGIIQPQYIMGYFNLEHEFTPNGEFEYGTDLFYDSDFSK